MENNDNRIVMNDDEGNEIAFYVLEETKINGMYYILVTNAEEDEDGDCYILKDVSKADDIDAIYEFVENDDELEYMTKIFAELMGDTEVVLEQESK